MKAANTQDNDNDDKALHPELENVLKNVMAVRLGQVLGF